MENTDQREIREDYAENVEILLGDIDVIEDEFRDTRNLQRLKEGLAEIAISLKGLGLFPQRKMLVRSSNGKLNIESVGYLILSDIISNKPEHFYFSDSGDLYKIISESKSKSAEDIDQWRDLSLAGDDEYGKMAPIIFKKFRSVIESSQI